MTKEARAASNRRLREKRYAVGVCGRCGKEPVRVGYTTGDGCLEYLRERYKKAKEGVR